MRATHPCTAPSLQSSTPPGPTGTSSSVLGGIRGPLRRRVLRMAAPGTTPLPSPASGVERRHPEGEVACHLPRVWGERLSGSECDRSVPPRPRHLMGERAAQPIHPGFRSARRCPMPNPGSRRPSMTAKDCLFRPQLPNFTTHDPPRLLYFLPATSAPGPWSRAASTRRPSPRITQALLSNPLQGFGVAACAVPVAVSPITGALVIPAGTPELASSNRPGARNAHPFGLAPIICPLLDARGYQTPTALSVPRPDEADAP